MSQALLAEKDDEVEVEEGGEEKEKGEEEEREEREEISSHCPFPRFRTRSRGILL